MRAARHARVPTRNEPARWQRANVLAPCGAELRLKVMELTRTQMAAVSTS